MSRADPHACAVQEVIRRPNTEPRDGLILYLANHCVEYRDAIAAQLAAALPNHVASLGKCFNTAPRPPLGTVQLMARYVWGCVGWGGGNRADMIAGTCDLGWDAALRSRAGRDQDLSISDCDGGRYSFFLAIENANKTDWVTERVYNAWIA
eukprot:142031-Rhodomonas_salina.1